MHKQPDGQYLINGLYLPALIAVLMETDYDAEAYSDFRWFSSLDQRLQAVGGKQLGAEGGERWIDAQRILDLPFARMPIVAKGGSGRG